MIAKMKDSLLIFYGTWRWGASEYGTPAWGTTCGAGCAGIPIWGTPCGAGCAVAPGAAGCPAGC